MTLGFNPQEVCAAAIRAGVVSPREEAAAMCWARLPGGRVDWAEVQRLLGLPNPVTHWNKFGG